MLSFGRSGTVESEVNNVANFCGVVVASALFQPDSCIFKLVKDGVHLTDTEGTAMG